MGFLKELEGTSTWYAYDSSGIVLGRIADTSTGVVWSSTELVDNGDGTYDLPISPEIFISFKTSNPLTEIPHTIYITMKASSSAISSIDGFKILVSDKEAEE